MNEPESLFSSKRKLFKRDMFRNNNPNQTGLLAPGEEPVDLFRRRVAAAISLALIGVAMFLPSYQIAKINVVKFPFELPAHVSEGGLIAFPVRASDQIVRIGQSVPTKLAAQNLYMMGFGLQDPAATPITVWSLSKPDHLGWFKRQWLSHPIEYSEQAIALDRLPAHAVVGKQARAIASVDDVSQFARTDGNARLDCWQAPLPFAPSGDFAAAHEGVDIKANFNTALKTAGAGEVIAADTTKTAGRVLTIYHGDGLYSRYSHLKEFQTRAGEQIAAGQMIGFTERMPIYWEVIWRGKHLNPSEVLKVSQQLCPQAKNPLAQKTNRADRSPASKIYRWMSHQGRQ